MNSGECQTYNKKQNKYMNTKDKSANDWLGELMKSTGSYGQAEKVPEGWMTIRDMSQMAGVSESTMKHRVDKWLKQDVLIKKKFKINAGRQLIEVAHYIKK